MYYQLRMVWAVSTGLQEKDGTGCSSPAGSLHDAMKEYRFHLEARWSSAVDQDTQDLLCTLVGAYSVAS